MLELWCMSNNTILILGIISAIVLVTCLFIIVKKLQKKSLKKKIDDLYVRFTEIKTVPLPFKLKKAMAMAKRNEETSKEVSEYIKKYDQLEKHLNHVQEMLNNTDDSLSIRSYKESLESIRIVSENMDDCQLEINEIDDYLEEFSRKENEQREYSSRLKEKYRVIKTTINKNSKLLSISYDGFLNRLQGAEELFTSSEDAMYASDYGQAQNDLEEIEDILENIKIDANQMHKLIEDVTGVIPTMLDETNRELALTRQRGIYVEHLNPNEKIKAIENLMAEDTKELMEGHPGEISKHIEETQETINELSELLENENRAFKEAKETNEKISHYISDLEKVENYVRVAYDKDSSRFGLNNVNDELKIKRESIEKYKGELDRINKEIDDCLKPSTEIFEESEYLFKKVDDDLKVLYSYKTEIDKSTDGETRALNQLIKLQLVVSEVETNLAEYPLPTIDDAYKEDLKKARDYIADIKQMTSDIPINIEKLNTHLDEAIDFIYKFYNNINNIVGMGTMVENAIVFGNKYRSTYPEIDRELSKAEFQYLNGEYTKALKTAISCMETLFPDNADEKILENAE